MNTTIVSKTVFLFHSEERGFSFNQTLFLLSFLNGNWRGTETLRSTYTDSSSRRHSLSSPLLSLQGLPPFPLLQEIDVSGMEIPLLTLQEEEIACLPAPLPYTSQERWNFFSTKKSNVFFAFQATPPASSSRSRRTGRSTSTSSTRRTRTPPDRWRDTPACTAASAWSRRRRRPARRP